MAHYIDQIIQPLPTVALFSIAAILLYALSKGADMLVDHAVSLSLHWGVPKLVIGATIVSLGTTLPEATVSVLAAMSGNPDLALGNAVGSIITNTGLIIGVGALLGHLPVDDRVINREGIIKLAVVTLLAVVSLPFFSVAEGGRISQWVGIVFVVLLAAYLYLSMRWSRRDSEAGEMVEENEPIGQQVMLLVIGVFVVIISSRLLIPVVELMAQRVGIPQSVIAATLVAFGTSLPELVTAISAVRKGHGELAVGNIVGANILNVLFVVGGAAAVTTGGLDVPNHFYYLQIPTMLVIVYIFRYFTMTNQRHITRSEGSILLVIYGLYLVLNYTMF